MNALNQPLSASDVRVDGALPIESVPASQAPAFRAWCFSDAVIFMGHETPRGATEIVRGPEQLVRSVLRVMADAGAVGPTVLVVPGMFETPDVRESFAVLRRWLGWCATKDGSGQLEWNVAGRASL